MLRYSRLHLTPEIVAGWQHDLWCAIRENKECCGFLIGRVYDEEGALAIDAIGVRNSSPESNRFLIPFHIKNQLIYVSRKRGLDIIGVYHCHIHSGPFPSYGDRNAIANSDIPWIILSPGRKTDQIAFAAYQPMTAKPIQVEVRRSGM